MQNRNSSERGVQAPRLDCESLLFAKALVIIPERGEYRAVLLRDRTSMYMGMERFVSALLDVARRRGA